MYRRADSRQIERLSQYVNCVQYTGQKFSCEKLFTTFDVSVIDTCEADYIAQVVHANYKAIGLKPNTHPRINEYIAVSKTVADAYKELSGIECKVIYNPLTLDKPKRVLKLISATRLTKEKGRERMVKLAELMTAEGIPFQWLVFTNSGDGFQNPSIIKVPPRLDLTDYIAEADYLVQLSDTEGYCYSVNEALNLGTPVIVTDIETFREEGVRDGENGYMLSLDMEGVDIDKIYNNIPSFKFTPNEVIWSKELAKGKSKYTMDKNKKILVEATAEYAHYKVIDKELGRIPKEGERFVIDALRFETLRGGNRYGAEFVKAVKETEEDTPAAEAVPTEEESEKEKAPSKRTPPAKKPTPSKEKTPSKKKAPSKKKTPADKKTGGNK